MINYITGIFRYMGTGFIIVECGGIGYSIQVSEMTTAKLPPLNSDVKIYTYMSVSENDISLFGFLSMEDLDMFNKLKTVNGVGAKSALGILGTLSPNEIATAVITEDIKQLSKCPGIGKKTAQRIALELRDKISCEDAIKSSFDAEAVNNDEKTEAAEGLMALGFSRSEAVTAINQVEGADLDASQIISKALKVLSR